MTNEIMNTCDVADLDWDGSTEPGEVETDMSATKEPTDARMEFHVSMRGYSMQDMDELIVQAAAQMIVGRRNEKALAKAIEAKAIEMLDHQASEALRKVTAEIIEQPVMPGYGDKKPVTMREFIGLTGREYLATLVNREGKPSTDNWGGTLKPRL